MDSIVAIMQPTYLPWIGYFELMDRSDKFVFLDDVQFNKKSWQQRNRIKGHNNQMWLTVPVLTKGRRFQKINEVEINNQQNWTKKHLKAIELSYAKSPFFEKYMPLIIDIYNKNWTSLKELNIALILSIRDHLGIDASCFCSSKMDIVRQERNDRIINICKLLDCTKLYDTEGAEGVIDSVKFKSEGIDIVFQKYEHPTYHQLHGNFISHLSAIDLLFNEGGNSLNIIRKGV